jgi:rod shape-determining protein MreC
MTAFTPFERAFVATGHFFRNTWHNYIDLHGVRKENRELQKELARLRLEQVRLKADASESWRLRALLDFKERYVGQTVAAEVIGTSGSDLSHTIQIDKGSRAGVKPDMAVITPDGIVGKVKEVFPLSSQVLMVNDRESGAGVLLENSRLQGILRGVGQGELQVSDVMSDEKVDVGEQVVTSGGDGIYPKGFPVGTVTKVTSDLDGGPFLAVKIKPAANLERLEEVLVVTKVAEESPVAAGDATPRRAAEILAERLPSVSKPPDSTAAKTPTTAGGNAVPAATSSPAAKTNNPGAPTVVPKQNPKTGEAEGKTPATGGVNAVPAGASSAGATTNKPGAPAEAPKRNVKTGEAAGNVSGTAAPARKPNAPVRPSPSPTPAEAVPAGNAQKPPNLQPEQKKSQQPPIADPGKPPR